MPAFRPTVTLAPFPRVLLIALAAGVASFVSPPSLASATPTDSTAAFESSSIAAPSDDEVVAIDTNGGRTPLLFLGGSLTDDELATLRESAPNVRIVQPSSAEEALRLAPEANGADARFISAEFLAAAPKLRWVQSPSAGVERYVAIRALRDRDDVVLTNMSGVHGATIAEHGFGMLLTLTRNLDYFTHPDRNGEWDRGGGHREPIALNGRTLLVVGLGGIGREAAKIGKGFGMRVLATRRSVSEPPPYVDVQGTATDLPELLPQADVVFLSVPLTDETRGLIDAEALALMKRGSFLVNVARGPVVDSAALLDAIRSGQLAGACLDVTDPEPLPASDPLWQERNVIITPHVSGRSELTSRTWKALYLDNVRRFGAGEPLKNVVDKRAGY